MNPEKMLSAMNGIGIRNCVNDASPMITATMTFPAKMFPKRRAARETVFPSSPMMFKTPMKSWSKAFAKSLMDLDCTNKCSGKKLERCRSGEIRNARTWARNIMRSESAIGCAKSDVDCRNRGAPSYMMLKINGTSMNWFAMVIKIKVVANNGRKLRACSLDPNAFSNCSRRYSTINSKAT